MSQLKKDSPLLIARALFEPLPHEGVEIDLPYSVALRVEKQ
jgi:hypothetical protein